MPDPSPHRRRLLLGMAGAAVAGPAAAIGNPFDGPAARLTADFEPLAATWLGFDAGHVDFTVALVAALQPNVALKMLVRDADDEAAARRHLADAGLDTENLRFVHDPDAPFFVRDAAVFAHDDGGRPALVDFRWSHYGWASWCARRHAREPRLARSCGSAGPGGIEDIERRLADTLGAAVRHMPLAMEGGGVEVNGAGVLIANHELWRSRNPGLSRAAIEQELLRLPGMQRVVWLPQGLAHDPLHRRRIVGRRVGWGTGGHTDQFVRFADARTVLLAWPDEAEAARHPVARLNLQRMQRNLEVLERSTDARGRALRVLKLPLPPVVERRIVLSAAADTRHSAQWSADSFPPEEGRREGDWVMQVASTSYLNFVVANGVVLLPDYLPHGASPALQQRVARLMAEAFPGRQLAWVDAMGANWVGGGAHCATLGEPQAA